jgi:hypothetical protein
MPEALHPLAPSVPSCSDAPPPPPHPHVRPTLSFYFILYVGARFGTLNSPNRSIFLNPTLTEGSNPKTTNVRLMQRIIQKSVPKRTCPERDFNA